MSCLGSKHELLQVADHVIAHYYQRVPFVRNHPQAIDLDMLVMELMGGSIKMFPLSKDGSMLGMTAHERLIIRMELKDGTIIRDTLRPKDIVIDSSLAGFHNTGVRNFTLAHEIGHQLLHIYYPLLALSDQLEGNRQISRRIKKHLWLSNRSWARDVHSFGILHSWGALAGKSCSAQASSIWLIAGAFRRTQSK